MQKRALTRRSFLSLSGAVAAGLALTGCEGQRSDGRTEIEFVSYKREAVSIFEALMAEFNESNDHIYLNFTSPNDAVTIMKTRFVREDYPDVVAIGGDASYADFVDSNILADVSGYPGMEKVQPAYQEIMKSVTYVPMDGIYGVPYIANAAGMLYNKDMFAEKGWDLPETWDEFIDLCEKIKAEGEAQYMQILSEAYNDEAKADFYNYVRALDALKASLTGDNKTIILDGDSELARVLSGNEGF